VRTLAAILLIVLAGGYAVDRWPGRRESSGRVMLAVLPLNAIGGGPEHEALTDGLTEGITTAVARLDPDRVAVIARSSVARYQHEVTPVADIGRALNVQYLLQGTVRVMSGRLRVTAQLVEVERESHVWADVYDRDLVDIFAVESEIAETVARRLSGRLLPGGGGSRRQPDSDAHVAYLQGLHFWNRRSEAGLRQAIERFHRAVDRDPGYARAHAGLASAYASLATSADAVPAADARALAEASARRALELDPDLPEGHVVMSAIACRFDWDWHACERGLQRALALDPNYATGRHLLG
jgi:TolB-like protein